MYTQKQEVALTLPIRNHLVLKFISLLRKPKEFIKINFQQQENFSNKNNILRKKANTRKLNKMKILNSKESKKIKDKIYKTTLKFKAKITKKSVINTNKCKCREKKHTQ